MESEKSRNPWEHSHNYFWVVTGQIGIYLRVKGAFMKNGKSKFADFIYCEI